MDNVTVEISETVKDVLAFTTKAIETKLHITGGSQSTLLWDYHRILNHYKNRDPKAKIVHHRWNVGGVFHSCPKVIISLVYCNDILAGVQLVDVHKIQWFVLPEYRGRGFARALFDKTAEKYDLSNKKFLK